MKGRRTISYPLLCTVRTLLARSPTASLTKHTNRQTPNNLTRAVLRLFCGKDDVRGAVEPPMAWLQASVTHVSHIVVLRDLRTAAVEVVGCNKIIGNTLTSSDTLSIAFLLTISAARLVRNLGLSYILNFGARTP